MKTLKTNKLFAVLMLVSLILSSFNVFAQKKELKTESDGFQWYKLEQNGKVGAQSINGTTLIPLSKGYDVVSYMTSSGGWFNGKKNGKWSSVYDKNGREIVAPGRYDEASYRCINSYEFVLVELSGKQGVCDMNGREIIAPKYETIVCDDGVLKYKNASGDLVSTGITVTKKSSTNYASTTTTTSKTTTTSTSSGKTSGSGGSKLLYKGRYDCGPEVYPSGMSFPDAFGSTDIEIYEDKIDVLGYGVFDFQGMANGKRKYSNGNDLYVDSNFNVTLYQYVFNVGTITKQFTRSGSSASSSQGGYYGGNGGYNSGNTGNNGGNSGNSSSTQQKTHKCSLCNGSGRTIKTNGTNLGGTKWCSECGKTVPDYHYHSACESCGGKGYW